MTSVDYSIMGLCVALALLGLVTLNVVRKLYLIERRLQAMYDICDRCLNRLLKIEIQEAVEEFVETMESKSVNEKVTKPTEL